RVDGVTTNLPLLRNLLRHPALAAYRVTTRFVDEHASELLAPVGDTPAPLAGARVDPRDPLAVLVHGKSAGVARRPPTTDALETGIVVRAPMQGTVVAVDVVAGAEVPAGGQLLVMEAMKMEHVIAAPVAGVVRVVNVSPGDTVYEGHALLAIDETAVEVAATAETGDTDLARIRPDLDEVQRRHEKTGDEARPDAVARRRASGQRTARENIGDLCDPGTFVEYGPLVIAAQRRRRSVE